MSMQGIEPDTTSYNTLLKAFAGAARRTIEERRQQGSQRRGRIGSTGTSKAAAKPRRSSGDTQLEEGEGDVPLSKKEFAKRMLEESFRLLEEIKSKGLKPDVISFNTLLAACAAASAEGRQTPKKGLKALQLMNEADVVPSAESFSLLMEACKVAELAGAQDSIEVGMRVKEFISNPQSQFYSTSLASSFQEQNGNVFSNETLLDAGATWMHSRLRWENVVSAEGLIDAHETARLASSVSEASASLINAGSNPFYARNIVSRIVDASATASQVRAFAELARTSADSVGGETLGAGEETFELGMRLFEDMQDQDVKPDSFTFTSLINTAKQSGNPEHISRVSALAALAASYACAQVYNLFQTTPTSERNHRMTDDNFLVVAPAADVHNAAVSCVHAAAVSCDRGDDENKVARDGAGMQTMTKTMTVQTFSQARFVDEAVEMLSSSRGHGLQPDLHMYSAALHAAARAVSMVFGYYLNACNHACQNEVETFEKIFEDMIRDVSQGGQVVVVVIVDDDDNDGFLTQGIHPNEVVRRLRNRVSSSKTSE
eukprot:761161-Hanusia_phi.AAC.4